MTSEIVHHLMDGVEPEHLAAARAAAGGVPGVSDVAVRGRWMGRSLTLDVEGHMDRETSLQDADSAGQAVEAAVRKAVDNVRHVRWTPGSLPPAS